MVGLGIHVFVYAVGISVVTAVWALAGDHSFTDVRDLIADIPTDPGRARDEGFWPVWIYVAWTALLALHIGIVTSIGVFGRRARQRRVAIARQAAHVAHQLGTRAVKTPRPPSGPTRQWVAVMFTDVVNSTSLTASLGDEEWTRVLSRHREFVRACFAARGGQEVGTQGDGSLARFTTPADAVACAVDIQRQLRDIRDDADHFPLEVRIGVHAGDAVEDGEGDIIGRVVNLAARVMSEAAPGEILVTEPVADHVDGDTKVEDRGLVLLRGFDQPRHLLAVSWE